MTRATKDSGVAWIGAIPQGWGVVRFKDLMSHKKKKISPILPPGAISFGQVVQKDDDKITEETKATYQAVLEGEILINPINLNYDLKSLRTALSDINVCVSPAYIVARAKTSVSKTWLKYLLFCFDVLHMKTVGAGVRQTITFDDIGNCAAVMPPLSVQLAIADFLDRQTALIDQRLTTLAEKKTVLAELRKATIHEAVTKGSTWNAETGQVKNLPTGWVMLRIKDVAKLRSGDFIAAENIEPAGDFPVYGGNGLRGFADSFTHNGEFALVGRQGALCGNVNYASGKFWATEHAVVVRHKRKVVTRWLGEMLCCMNLNQYATASAQPGLSVEIIVNKFLPFPPFDEQRAIAKHLDQQTQQFDAQLSTLDVQAQVLKELRKAIIHEAVTGKIDLSHNKLPQPQQALAA